MKKLVIILSVITAVVLGGLYITSYYASMQLNNSFSELEKGIEKTIESYDALNEGYYNVLLNSEDSVAAIAIHNQVEKVAELIDRTIADLRKYGDENAMNEEIGFDLLVNQGRGQELKIEIDQLRKIIIDHCDDARVKTIIATTLNTSPVDPEMGIDYGRYLSEHLPLASVTANLTLIKSYVKNAEADALSSLRKPEGDSPFIEAYEDAY